jgi:RNA-directed DNA polymerase
MGLERRERRKVDGAKDRTTEGTPAKVPIGAKQAGEARDRWSWVEPSVWTQRMLAALEKGVKGGIWFSLIDKVCSMGNLHSAFASVKRNGGSAGVDHQSIEKFEAQLEANLERLSESIKDGTYRPSPIRRVYIPKPGKQEKRPLGIPTVRDRVAQAALRHVLEPIYERDFAEHSYGFRPNRGCKDALRRVNRLLGSGYTWVVDADLKSYFDTIPHQQLMDRVGAKVADGRVLKLIESYLHQEVLDTAKQWTPQEGSPQGAVLSPLLSNIYLDPLDHHMAGLGYQMVRYADDFIILCRSEQEARETLEQVKAWTAQAGLTLHPEKTRIVDATQKGGFDFLGYHFERGYRWPGSKSLGKFKDAIRAKTHRTNGLSLAQIISTINRSLKGWYEYFKHSHPTTFPVLDSWIRMRLRSILRRRNGRRGRGRGSDHHRWPNAFFAARGLFSAVTAHARDCQS